MIYRLELTPPKTTNLNTYYLELLAPPHTFLRCKFYQKKTPPEYQNWRLILENAKFVTLESFLPIKN